MSLIDTIIARIVPHDCLGCGAEGDLLCLECSDRLPNTPEDCYRCRRPSAGSLTCASCLDEGKVAAVCAGTVYSGSAKDLVWRLKLFGARSAASVMARRLTPLLSGADSQSLIIPVPTATSRVRQRGYDQAQLLARELSRQAHLPYRALLARSGQQHQHGLTRGQRLNQLDRAFRVTRPLLIKGLPIILVDDVVTTGSTLEAAAATLLAAGAQSVQAVVFAQPPAVPEH